MSIDSRPEITSPKVEQYLYDIQRPRDPVLAHLEEDADRNGVPIVGPLVGNFLSMMAISCRAKNILEIGTATGYSGIWLARVAKQNGGNLTTVERDPSRAAIAKKSFKDAGLEDAINLIQGDAKAEVPRLVKAKRGAFELVFIDVGDKSIYTDLLEDCVSLLAVGGFLIADNTLWQGKVPDPTKKDIDTRSLRQYNKLVYSDKRLRPAIVPLRDGVTLALKLSD